MTPPAWYEYAAAALEREQRRELRFTFAGVIPALHWDGIYRCEDHPAGTHFTIDEAEFCIQGEPT